MFGTREFRFSYTDVLGDTSYIMARNEWQAAKAVEARKLGDPKSVKRAPFPKKKITTGHCQICDREIGTTTGLIAHHGYTRPGHGWQTASCFGARWRPYEVACDALPPAIESLQGYIANLSEHIASWLREPPATITFNKEGKYNYGTRSYDKIPTTVERPVDFDPTAEVKRDHYNFDTYAQRFHFEIERSRMEMKHLTYDLNRLQKRLADWKAPK